MEISRKWRFSCLLLGLYFLATSLQGVQGEVESEGPSESECRPYIEKALKELETADTEPVDPGAPNEESKENISSDANVDDSEHGEDDIEKGDKSTESTEAQQDEAVEDNETQEEAAEVETEDTKEEPDDSTDNTEQDATEEEHDAEKNENEATDDSHDSHEDADGADSKEDESADSKEAESADSKEVETADSKETVDSKEAEDDDSKESDGVDSKEAASEEAKKESAEEKDELKEDTHEESDDSAEKQDEDHTAEKVESEEDELANKEATEEPTKKEGSDKSEENIQPDDANKSGEESENDSKEDDEAVEGVEDSHVAKDDSHETKEESHETKEDSQEHQGESADSDENIQIKVSEVAPQETEPDTEEEHEDATTKTKSEVDAAAAEFVEAGDNDSVEKQDEEAGNNEEKSQSNKVEEQSHEDEASSEKEDEAEGSEETSSESVPEEDLTLDIEIPDNLRSTDHVDQLLKLDDSNIESETVMNRVSDITLRELKRMYENAIKPLEILYKYRDLSNRHFGDSEIFSKPLVVFMGPWSGGKSSIINYLTDNEYNETSLRTGAEPSPAYFNLLMYGSEPEVLDGTQLAADYTFSGLQKFGQGLEERLRGLKLPSKLLEKINIVEIPGILEVRKQVSRVFPFNDACQWFIDRSDIIFLVYDPSKLDVGPETEAILDQLKGREHQTRIVLNKADQVKPEELMRVQGALIWNISPLMSSAQPPMMYTASLWSRPYETWAPVRLLQAQERAFLRDLRSAVDKRIENKISSARRFAVRVRNHAKMVDCYLTTYYNHKSVFGNRKQVSDKIIEHPQDYHIYEGLSTLTNISRYDLPDPDVYRDFFRLNPLYDFQQLSATCTYFRGCPINRLDVAIAYDLPELLGKHKKLVEAALAEIKNES